MRGWTNLRRPGGELRRSSLRTVGYLSEGVVGTAAALSAVLDRQGWTVNAVVVGIAGMG